MELVLQVITDPCPRIEKSYLRIFSESGGTIGRAPDNDWVLPDPRSYLSNRHCIVMFRDGAFWMHDASRNGIYLNGAKHRVGYGHKVKITTGDRLQLANYTILATVHDSGQPREVAQRDDETTGEHPVAAAAELAGSEDPPSSVAGDVVTDELPVATETAERPADDDQTSAVTAEPDELTGTRAIPEEMMPGYIGLPSSGRRRLETDISRLRRDGMLPAEADERATRNQFRRVKRPVIVKAFGKASTPPVPNGRLVMVASALSGEGKTFCSLNLALSLARERDLDVLLVDADLAKPHLSEIFGVKDDPGLPDAIASDAIDVESLVFGTDIEQFSFLPAGRGADDSATELLASAEMEAVVAKLGRDVKRRIVVFDSPPLLLTEESHVLATVAGQVLVVVRAGVTPQGAVLEALGRLEESKPVGLVLNQSTLLGTDGRYGTVYGYGYGYGYGQIKPQVQESPPRDDS